MQEYLKKLNKEQLEAATSISGYVRILAGAGSGKTATIISRVAYMLDNEIKPENILLITFTNKAAKEMQNRVSMLIGEPASKITACTYHSFCANILRRNIHSLGIDRNFNIIDSADVKDAMSIARQEFLDKYKKSGIEYDLKDFPNIKEITGIYEWTINSCMDIHEVIKRFEKLDYEDEIKEIIEFFIGYKRSRNLLDYDDLLYFTKVILEKDEKVRKYLSDTFKYVMVDEYQDTSNIQSKIMDLLTKDLGNYCVCGDDQQSIYSWRCAEIKNIIEFDKVHAGCKTVILKENYRSSQEILDFSNAMMNHATEGVIKQLHGQFNEKMPELIITHDNYGEYDFILNKIKQLHEDGKNYNDMAVMVRSARQSYVLETMLNTNGIPYEKFGGIKFLEKPVIKDVLAFLRGGVNEKDELALFRILRLYPGIGIKFAKTISAEIVKNGFEFVVEKYKKRKFGEYLRELSDTVLKIKTLNVQEQLKYLVEDSYYKKVRERTIEISDVSDSDKVDYYDDLEKQMEDSKMLLNMASKYRSANSFLTDLILDATVEKDSSEDVLNITTVHSAKGLEYDVVFLMDVLEGHFPKCDESSDENPEEFRTMYVAATRPRHELYVMAPSIYATAYSVEHTHLSHFINKEDILKKIKIRRI